jgi:hypothetical protein
MRRVSLFGAMLAAGLAAASWSSAIAQGPGAGQGYGWGMMGPGMHGYGQGYGPGMMGPGYGPGMMGPGYGQGMMGPGYGPGMMGPGYGQGMMGPGYGPGMMSPGYGPGTMYGYGPGMGPRSQGQQANLNLSASDVKAYLESWISNPRLKVGDVKEKDANTIEADIVTKDGNALVQRFVVDRHTGFYRPSAS